MKLKNVLSAAGLASLVIMSCNDEKDNKGTTTTAATTENASTVTTTAVAPMRRVVTMSEVPQPIVVNFKKKYPSAMEVQWLRYDPLDTLYIGDMPVTDTNYYYSEYKMDDGSFYTTWWDPTGEWVKTSTVMTGNPKLPDAVNKAINDNYPGYTIEKASKENDKNMEMYEVKLKKGDDKVKIKYLPNGEVFKIK